MSGRPNRHLAPALALVAAMSLAVWSARAHDEAVTVIMTKADCARLVEHVPAPGVAYQPGVDVHGNPVVPADLNGGPRIEAPETLVIDIEIDLLQRFGIPLNPALFDGDAEVGEVTYRNGRFYFDGQPLQDEAQAELAARCQKVERDRQ